MFLDRSAGRSASTRRAPTATTSWRRSRRCTTGGRTSSSRWAATSSPPRPTPTYTAEALRRCRLTAHVSTKLNRAHLVTGRQALILPCLGRTELDVQAAGPQFVTVEDSMSVVHASRGGLPPASEAPAQRAGDRRRPGAARRSGPVRTSTGHRFAADYDRIRDRIAEVIPGFEDFNARVRQPGGFVLPNAAARAPVRDGHRQGPVHRPADPRIPPGRRASC